MQCIPLFRQLLFRQLLSRQPANVTMLTATASFSHVFMLSIIQAVCGLPRLRAPGIVPCNIFLSKQLPCFLMV